MVHHHREWDGSSSLAPLDVGLGPQVLRENAHSHSVKITWMAILALRSKKVCVHPCNNISPLNPWGRAVDSGKAVPGLHLCVIIAMPGACGGCFCTKIAVQPKNTAVQGHMARMHFTGLY